MEGLSGRVALRTGNPRVELDHDGSSKAFVTKPWAFSPNCRVGAFLRVLRIRWATWRTKAIPSGPQTSGLVTDPESVAQVISDSARVKENLLASKRLVVRVFLFELEPKTNTRLLP